MCRCALRQTCDLQVTTMFADLASTNPLPWVRCQIPKESAAAVAARRRAGAGRRSLELPARRDAARRAAPLRRARRGAARHRAEHPDRPPAAPRTRRRRARRAVFQATVAHGVPPHQRRATPGERAAAARRLGRSAVRERRRTRAAAACHLRDAARGALVLPDLRHPGRRRRGPGATGRLMAERYVSAGCMTASERPPQWRPSISHLPATSDGPHR